MNNTLKPVGRRLAELLTPQEVQKSPPELTGQHGKAQCLRSAPTTWVGWNVTEALRKTGQN